MGKPSDVDGDPTSDVSDLQSNRRESLLSFQDDEEGLGADDDPQPGACHNSLSVAPIGFFLVAHQ